MIMNFMTSSVSVSASATQTHTLLLLRRLPLPLPPPPKPPSFSSLHRPSPINHLHLRSFSSVQCQAAGEPSPSNNNNNNNNNNTSAEAEAEAEAVVYHEGVYGPWKIEPSDIQEVILYRSGLVTAAASFVLASSAAFLQYNSSSSSSSHADSQLLLEQLILRNLDVLYALGASGLGLSLFLIHIYVTEIKRALQALWVIGVVGSLATYAAGMSLVEYVVQNPTAVWFVGPLFAALTGLVFKEGLCYGKLEAGILTFIIPTLLLGHLSGLMDEGTKLTLLGVWMALFVVFAGRKFTQPIKDDIGDKSVFIFNALPPEEKAALIEKLEDQNYPLNL